MYLAVRKSRSSSSSERPGQLAFIRIYRGTKTSCTVSPAHLANAYIDSSAPNRPAVVFRIAAKNEQGYGPATQIRWLQGTRQDGGWGVFILTLNQYSGGILTVTTECSLTMGSVSFQMPVNSKPRQHNQTAAPQRQNRRQQTGEQALL